MKLEGNRLEAARWEEMPILSIFELKGKGHKPS